jgi:hypothetical protein
MLAITYISSFCRQLLLQTPYVVLQVFVPLELSLDVLYVSLKFDLAVVGLLKLLAEGVKFDS